MPSRTHVCNSSLIIIGENPITDIEDITVPAKRCKLIFEDIADEVSSSKYWSKLKKRVELALLQDPPEYEFNFQFQLPSDNLQVLSINEFPIDNFQYQIEDNKLLINQSSIFIKYIQHQRNPEKWGKFLERAVVLRMAAELCYITTGDSVLSDKIFNRYILYSKTSAATDSNQGSRRKVSATTITRVR